MFDNIQQESIKAAESYLADKARLKMARELAWLYGIAFSVMLFILINWIMKG